MADAKNAGAAPAATKLSTLAIVKRAILAGKDKTKPVTKDGKDHTSGAVVLQLRAATDAGDFTKAVGDFLNQVNAVETGAPVVLVNTAGAESAPRVATTSFVDGKTALVRGKDLYPTTYAQFCDYINAAIKAVAATKLTNFNNKEHKTADGSKPAGSSTAGVTNFDDMA